MSTAEFQRIRKSVLADVRGEVFEIGFGTGLNLPHYPNEVKRITTVDPNPGAGRIAKRRIAQSSIEVVHRVLHGEKVPLDDETFDSVACTFTLCSIGDVLKALGEMRRILKPGGRFFFVEHGLSNDPRWQWWQHKLNPLQRIIGDGCNLDRDPVALLRQAQFRIEKSDNFYLESAPRFAGYLYRGVAVKD